MANLYKKTYPIPMPDGAEIVTRRNKPVVQWRTKHGKLKTAPLAEDGKRMMYVSEVWYARYTDHTGNDKRISTGCRDEQAAQRVLSDVLAEQEKIRAGFITPKEIEVAEHSKAAITEHIEKYLDHLKIKRVRGRKVSENYRKNVKCRLNRLVQDLKIKKLADITSDAMNRWLSKAEDKDMAAATRNEYVISMHAFCNWLVREQRIVANPVTMVQKADRASDRRHIRRALTIEEVGNLLHATSLRPIAEWGRGKVEIPKSKRKGRQTWKYETITQQNLDACYERGLAKLKQPHIKKLERLGQERALFYLMAVSTGLRHKELRSLTLGQLFLDAKPAPYFELYANQSKSGKESRLPLRADVVEKIRQHLEHRSKQGYKALLFDNPPGIRVFDADCQAAGIAKNDARGRVVDIHALRTTFGTHLAVAGVHPRVAQAAMRHSRIELTTNFYTDPALLDVNGAVNALPDFAFKG